MAKPVCPSCEKGKCEPMEPVKFDFIQGSPEGYTLNIKCPECTWVGDINHLRTLPKYGDSLN